MIAVRILVLVAALIAGGAAAFAIAGSGTKSPRVQHATTISQINALDGTAAAAFGNPHAAGRSFHARVNG